MGEIKTLRFKISDQPSEDINMFINDIDNWKNYCLSPKDLAIKKICQKLNAVEFDHSENYQSDITIISYNNVIYLYVLIAILSARLLFGIVSFFYTNLNYVNDVPFNQG